MYSLLTLALGAGAVAFGLPPFIAPTWCGRLLGIAHADNPTVATAIRSVGIRDVVIGAGLVRAVRAGDAAEVQRWLVARAASDAGDSVAVGLAVAAGARGPRFLALGAVALSAAAFGGALLRFSPRRG
jgi:hypothetical protein